MNIATVLRGKFPPEIRISKAVPELLKNGHKVSLICEINGEEAKHENYQGLEIERRRLIRSHSWVERIRRICSWVFCSRRVEPGRVAAYVEHFRRTEADIAHCHDIVIIDSVLQAANIVGIPVVADLHENMPAAKDAYVKTLSVRSKLTYLLTLSSRNWRRLEKRVLSNCRAILIVTEEAGVRLCAKYGIDSSKVVLVGNTEDTRTWGDYTIDDEIQRRYTDHWTACYIGGIGPHRGVDTSIAAAGKIGKDYPEFKLLIVGAGPSERRLIDQWAEQHNATRFVETVGWVPFEKVPSYMKASKVCLVPHNDTEHTQTTIPHKIFQYMMMKKAVIVSDCKPLLSVLEAASCGFVFEASNPSSMAQTIKDAINTSRGELDCLGQNGYDAATGRYSWKYDAARLIELYRELESEFCSDAN